MFYADVSISDMEISNNDVHYFHRSGDVNIVNMDI